MNARERLKQQHARLDQDLAREEAKLVPDAGLIAQIKRQKLMLKDEIQKTPL